MAGTPFTIGADASCTDGVCGEVSRVVVDRRALYSPTTARAGLDAPALTSGKSGGAGAG